MAQKPTHATDGGDVAESADDYYESHPLTRLFGDTPRIRILTALLEAGEPLNPAGIADTAGIEVTSWYRHKDDLLATDLVVKSGQAGNSPLYRIVDADELPDGDARAEWLDKIADWTSAALRDSSDQEATDGDE